jgi:NAD+ kinase
MSDSPLRIVVLARSDVAHVRDAWESLRPVIEQQPGLELEAVDLGGGLDFTRVGAELAVVLGGDGAILRACRQMGYHQLPILGVNLGRLGFLADISPAEFSATCPKLVAREFTCVSHLMYACRVQRNGGEQPSFLGLNEVAISCGASFKMFDVHLSINHQPVTTYSGDGLIVSTPVGSTAHNLSAGGPILRQDLQTFVITPICPHTISIRPIVDSADCVYSLKLDEIPAGVTLIIDGQLHVPLESGDLIEVTRAPVSFQLVKLPGMSFYSTLHRKLGWGGQPNYRPR